MDPDGNEVRNSFTDKTHNAALNNFISTNEGKAFINRYLKQGENFMGIIGDGKGDRANDLLVFESANMFDQSTPENGGVYGKNETLTKDGLAEASVLMSDNEALGGFRQLITLDKGMNEMKSSMVLGHEAFVHADFDANNLSRINEKINAGGYKNMSELLKDIKDNVINTGTRDHNNLKNGNVKKYEKYASELSKSKKTDEYNKEYNRDKNSPDNY